MKHPKVLTKQNQVHPPRPKKMRVDTLGNDRRKIFFKSGNSTMLFCKDLTENGARAMSIRLTEHLKRLGTKLEGSFIVVK